MIVPILAVTGAVAFVHGVWNHFKLVQVQNEVATLKAKKH
jgi:hypothetical protein